MYLLSLPWTHALPVALSSSMLHWLISQFMSKARTDILDTYSQPPTRLVSGSLVLSTGDLAALLFGSGMVLGMVLNGFRKLKPGVLVGNNSLAITAACQSPKKEIDAQVRRMQWGAVEPPEGGRPGYYCFTSQDVESPRLGELYI